MKCRLSKRVKRLNILLLSAVLLVFMSCKKEVVEVPVDAFAQVDSEVKFNQGVYHILFTLQKYPYKEIGVRWGDNKNLFHQNAGLTTQSASNVGSNRYGIFLNSLAANKIYYYQIYVRDSASDKEVYSDIFSFTTNP